jgi:electron transfer flavoprotein beta subunit
MKIICMVKIVPDVEKFKYDFERNTVVRENVRMILNPDDASCVGFALKFKVLHPQTTVEVVTMGPMSVTTILEDLLRIGVDKATLISDSCFSGSDSYATSRILAKYLKTAMYDCILTGTHAIDGDTSHVPAQIGEVLDIAQMSNVVKIHENLMDKSKVVFTVDNDLAVSTYQMELPGILSLQKESKYKLPYIKYEDLNKDVKDKLNVVSNSDLNFKPEEIGLKGSLTKVNRTFVKEYEKRNKVIVGNDDEGIEVVYSYLQKKGFV